MFCWQVSDFTISVCFYLGRWFPGHLVDNETAQTRHCNTCYWVGFTILGHQISHFPWKKSAFCFFNHIEWSGEVWLVVFDFDTNTLLDLVKYNDVIVGCKHFINKNLCCFWVPVTDMSNRQWELPWLKSLNCVVRVSSEIMRFVGAHWSYNCSELLCSSLFPYDLFYYPSVHIPLSTKIQTLLGL